VNDQDEAAAEFQQHRPRLLGTAYRLLGSAWDAEDVVEEAAIRWLQADRSTVRKPIAFLTTVVSRLALDQLRSAQSRREAYYGPWLPEPVLTDNARLGPLETAEQRESMSLATLRLMEQLSPPERAVFVLRTAFDIPYDEIATVLDISPDNARQLLHRAQTRLAEGHNRFQADTADHTALFERFLAATAGGDLGALQQLLAEDVVAYNDGGGKVRAALQPIIGSRHVLRFITGLVDRYTIDGSLLFVEANGHPAVIMSMGGQRQLVAIGARQGRITEIFAVINPEKLTYTDRQLQLC
jgi:RNA polymerase sigma-70 factor (ECF subfamily)